MTGGLHGTKSARHALVWPILAAVLLGPAFCFTIGRDAEAWRQYVSQGHFIFVVEAVGVGFGGFLVGLVILAIPFWLRKRNGKDTKGLYYTWAFLTAAFTAIGSGALSS